MYNQHVDTPFVTFVFSSQHSYLQTLILAISRVEGSPKKWVIKLDLVQWSHRFHPSPPRMLKNKNASLPNRERRCQMYCLYCKRNSKQVSLWSGVNYNFTLKNKAIMYFLPYSYTWGDTLSNKINNSLLQRSL